MLTLVPVIVTLVSGIVVGIVLGCTVPIFRMIFFDKGHRVLLVANAAVQDAVTNVVKEYAGLAPIMEITSGGTHQKVLSDSSTVIMWVDPTADISTGGFTFVVNDFYKRADAVLAFETSLRVRGYNDVVVYEPDRSLPAGTLTMISSPTALPGGAIGFRPGNMQMSKLAPGTAKML